MASEVDVANRALQKLGESPITSLLDASKPARTINACFAALRDDELRNYGGWQFALKRAALAADVDTPVYEWQYQYTLPTDYLALDQVGETFPTVALDDYIDSDLTDYSHEGNKILTNWAAPIYVRYVARIEDPNQWDVLFREVLACRIAYECAEPLTQSEQKKQSCINDYKEAMKRAISANAFERPPVMLADDSWIFSRL